MAVFSAFCCPAVACSARGLAAEQAACGCPRPSKGNVAKAYALTVNEQMIVPWKKGSFLHHLPKSHFNPQRNLLGGNDSEKKKKIVVFNIKERAMVNSGNTAKPASQSLDRSLTHTHIIVPPFLSILPTRISLGFSRLISLSQGDETSLLK